MPPLVATAVYALGIIGLFLLNRERNERASKALWIPVVWLLINGSRPVSVWMQADATISSPDAYLDGSPLDAGLFAFLLASGLVVLCGRWPEVRQILQRNKALVLFFGYCALSTLWSDYTFVASKRWIKATGDVVMALVVLTDPDRLSAMKKLFARVAFVLVPVSVLLVKYYPALGRSYNPWTWLPSYCGVTTEKNLLGTTCLFCGLGCLWCFLREDPRPRSKKTLHRRLAHGSIIAMVLWLLQMADSATSFSLLMMCGFLMTVMSLSRFSRRQCAIHLMVAAVILVSLFALFSESGGGMVEALGRDSTLTGRTAVWDAVLKVSENPFLGSGFESFWLGQRLLRVWELIRQPGVQEAHNGYLEVYLNLGWVGVALLVLLIAVGYRTALHELRSDGNLGRLRLGLFVAVIVYNLVEAGFRMMSLVWISFLLSTIAVPPAAKALPAARAGLGDAEKRLETGTAAGPVWRESAPVAWGR